MDIHPTETAGDGRLKPRRTTYAPGDTRQELLECAQCGFLFRPGKDIEGDSQESPGIEEVVTTVVVNNNVNKLPVHLKNVAAFLVSSVNVSEPIVSSGCRFCGSLNPKAIGRNKDFEYPWENLENK